MSRTAAVACVVAAALGSTGCPLVPSARPARAPSAFEIRVASTDSEPNDEIKRHYAGSRIEGVFHVWTAGDGHVTAVVPMRSIGDCDAFVISRLQRATFQWRDFTMNVAVVFPPPSAPAASADVSPKWPSATPAATAAPAAPKPRNVPPYYFDAQVAHRPPFPGLPDNVKAQVAGHETTFVAKLCTDCDGNITEVSVIESIPGADAVIVDSLRQWQLRPQPTPICSLIRLVYSVNARPTRK